MGPHVTSNICKANGRKSRSGADGKPLNNTRRSRSRSGTPDLIAASTSRTNSCTTPVQQEKSVKIDKTAEVRTNRRRSQRGSARYCGEVALVGGGVRAEVSCCTENVSGVNAEADTIEKPPNAAVCDTMAPALTEPLSPTEKLSSSTVKATPSTRSSSKRVSESSVTTNASTVNNNATSGREKRSRNTSTSISSTTPAASTSARVTRSKDAYQRVFEQAVSPTTITPLPAAKESITSGSASPAASGGASIKESTVTSSVEATSSSASPGHIEQTIPVASSNEPMLHNNNNNRNINSKGIDEFKFGVVASASEATAKGISINNIPNTNSKSNSTEQLLADLTDDFEEAITAEICLRKQLKESNLSKDAPSNVTSVSETSQSQPKDILVIKAGGAASVASKTSQHQLQQQHMESAQSSCAKDDDTTTLTTELQTQSRVAAATTAGQINAAETKQPSSDGTSKSPSRSTTVATASTAIVQAQQNEDFAALMVSPPTSTELLHTVAQETEHVTAIGQKHEPTRLQILSVEELPPISTDSTMTASEVEDNLEERLSQLDGTAIASPECEESNIAATIGTIPATPPRTPTKQHLQQLHQQQVQQLQQQLQQTPPTPLSQQVHHHQLTQNAFTPQSSSSSMNTLSSTNLPQAFMKDTAAGELEDQDIEEVLKALKGFDGSAGADTLCDLNTLFNEVYTLNYEEVSSQPTSTSTKPNPLKDMQCEIERKQQSMQRKIDFLLRRVRKIQTRYMSKHTSEEIAGLFEWSSRMVAGKVGAIMGVGRDGGIEDGSTPLRENVIAARPPAISWIEEKKNPVPSSQMVAMLRRLEAASNAQQLCTSVTVANTVHTNSHIRKSKKALLEMQTAASTSAATASPSFSGGADRRGETVVGTFDQNVAEEITHVAGLLQTEMREVQTAIDSDATESSSGGESADEMVTYSNQIQQPLSIAKRAAWRYSRDRAVIASRWAWLLSQIADLEIRIRQHGELHQEIVRTKGVVACGLEEQFLPGMTKSSELAATAASSSVNGYKNSVNMLSGVAMPKSEINAEEWGLPGSCRTRGYIPTQFRKRKLFQTTNIHTISKKAARTSTIKCGCQWPLQPCALCTGRSDPTAPRDAPDTMMMADRVALLDPGYHPVLSFPEDITNALHLEAIARMPEWQQRVMRCQVKSIAKSIWKAEREAAAAAGHHTSKKYGEHTVKRRYIKKKNRLAAEEKNDATNASTSTTTAAAGTHAATTATVTATSTVDGAMTGSSQAMPATPAAASTLSSEAGNGTGILSASTTPLVANKLAKNAKKLHYHLVGDGVLLEPPLSPVATNHSGVSQSSHHSTNSANSNNYIHQTSDYPPQNYDPYNPNPAHSSLISSSNSNGNGGGSNNHKYNNYKHRKSSTTTAGAGSNAHNNQNSNYHYNNNNSSQYYNNVNSNSEFSFLYTNDNWDGYAAARSRNSSPTHGSSSSNYHKYERSKNRTSYDIDNIVIPYSVAAATRVEILPYKEIPTPKWRVIELAERERALNNATSVSDMPNEQVVTTPPTAEHKSENISEVKAVVSKMPCSNENAVDDVLEQAATVETVNAVVQQKAEHVAETLIDGKVSIAEKHNNNNVRKQKNVAAKLPDETLVHEQAELVPVAVKNSIAVEPEPLAKKPKLDGDNVVHKACAETEMNKQAGVNATNVVAETELAAATAPAAFTSTRLEKPRTRRLVRSATVDADDGTLAEDITDEAITQRHERALAEERRKFQTYLKFPWSTRSRANRRIDSRAESSGANTPDPTSPAPQTPSVGGGDQESIPSPLAPSTPLNPLDIIPDAGESASTTSMANCASKRLERRRTTSTKKERELERRSSTPDPRELVPPYEPLQFPLTDEALHGLMKAMPVEFHYLDDSRYSEDCNSIVVSKYTRNRSNWRSDSTVRRGPGKTTTHNYCDANNKRQRINNSATNNRRGYYGSVGGGGGGNRQQRLSNYALGKDMMNDDGDGDESMHEADDDDVDMLLDEDDDDYDYPKHHLAPDDDLYENATDGGTSRGANGAVDDEYGAYVGGGHRSMLGLAGSEGDSSDTEPFADDDPNDPEWRGERDERGEKLRKNVR